VPLVSVRIPSYKHAAFIEECVRSVLAQSVTDLEIIVVDDCGGDNSVALVRALDDPRIRVYENEQNLGTYSTLNVALGHATGDWIAILNSDDRWHPDKLEKQLVLLNQTKLAWSYTLGQQIDAAGEVLPFDQHQDWPTESVQDLTPHLLECNRILASSVVFRRGAATMLDGLCYCGDWMLALKLALAGPAAFVDEPLTDWRQHGANSYLPSDRLLAEEMLVRLSLHEALSEEYKTYKTYKTYGSYEHLAALLILANHMHEAKHWAEKSGNKKRQLIASLPGPVARKLLWKSSQAREIPVPVDLLDLKSYFRT